MEEFEDDDRSRSPEITSMDSQKISRMIIHKVKDHPVLYISDIKGVSVKLPDFRPKVWKRIADELGLDPTWVKLRWKNLRDTYSRIVKGRAKLDPGAKKKKWIYEDDFDFIKFPFESDYLPMELQLTEEYVNDINNEVIEEPKDSQDFDNDDDEDGGRINFNEYLELVENPQTKISPDNSSKRKLKVTKHKISSENEGIMPNTRIIAFEDDAEESFEENLVHGDLDDTGMGQQFLLDLNDEKIESKFCPSLDDQIDQIQSKYRKIAPKDDVEKNYVPDQSVKNKNSNNRVSPRKTDSNSNCGDKSSIELFFKKMAEIVGKLPPRAQEDIKMELCKIVNEAEILYGQTTLEYNELPGAVPQVLLVPYYMFDKSNTN